MKTNVTPREGGIGGCTVEFVYDDGNRVSINLRDEDAEDSDGQDLILKSKVLLDHADASVSEATRPSMTLTATRILTRLQTTLSTRTALAWAPIDQWACLTKQPVAGRAG